MCLRIRRALIYVNSRNNAGWDCYSVKGREEGRGEEWRQDVQMKGRGKLRKGLREEDMRKRTSPRN
jgi:hypothetical protein